MQKEFRGYRKDSRRDWGRTYRAGEEPTTEQVQLGAILRIADAMEKMAARHTELMNECDRLDSAIRMLRKDNDRLSRSNAALRGHLNKSKKRLA